MEQAITIDHPQDSATIAHRAVVSGRAWGNDDPVIQCLVLSADGRWYTQKPVLRTFGTSWLCTVVLGYHQWTHGDYTIAAGIGGKRILEPSVASLPEDVLWAFAYVSRANPSD